MSTSDLIQRLSKSERFLLEWLAKEDASAYGECKGNDLDHLVSLGLLTVDIRRDRTREDWAEVRLTDAGRAVLADEEIAKGPSHD